MDRSGPIATWTWKYPRCDRVEVSGGGIDFGAAGKQELGESQAEAAVRAADEGTAFGGSVSSVALLAGWALVNLNLDRLSTLKFDYVVVQDTEMSYIKPIDSDFTAVAEVRSSADIELFTRALEKHGRGRLSMQIAVSSSGGVCARMTARFVAQVKPTVQPVANP